MEAKNKNFLEETRKLWQQRTLKTLSIEDAQEISSNIETFFNVLLEWMIKDERNFCVNETRNMLNPNGEQS